jgi:DNA-binding response OmpR family regulator
MRLLLVEDSVRLQELLGDALNRAGYGLDAVGTIAELLNAAASIRYDLIIIDLGLPDGDGLDAIRSLRKAGMTVPILIITARGSIEQRVDGLDSGADDYLTKPFGIRELLARIRALLRRGETSRARAAAGSPAGPITYKHIEIDPARRRVRIDGTDADLTFNEFELLYVLVSNPGIVFSREGLLSKVWKDQTFVTVRSVDTLVKRLRKKIEADPANPKVIMTVWGAGYKAADE